MQNNQRYQAVLQNGQRLQGKALTDWHEPHAFRGSTINPCSTRAIPALAA